MLPRRSFFFPPLFKAGKSDAMRTRTVFPTVVATRLICARRSYGTGRRRPDHARGTNRVCDVVWQIHLGQGSHERWLGYVRFSAGLKRLLW